MLVRRNVLVLLLLYSSQFNSNLYRPLHTGRHLSGEERSTFRGHGSKVLGSKAKVTQRRPSKSELDSSWTAEWIWTKAYTNTRLGRWNDYAFNVMELQQVIFYMLLLCIKQQINSWFRLALDLLTEWRAFHPMIQWSNEELQ